MEATTAEAVEQALEWKELFFKIIRLSNILRDQVIRLETVLRNDAKKATVNWVNLSQQNLKQVRIDLAGLEPLHKQRVADARTVHQEWDNFCMDIQDKYENIT